MFLMKFPPLSHPEGILILVQICRQNLQVGDKFWTKIFKFGDPNSSPFKARQRNSKLSPETGCISSILIDIFTGNKECFIQNVNKKLRDALCLHKKIFILSDY